MEDKEEGRREGWRGHGCLSHSERAGILKMHPVRCVSELHQIRDVTFLHVRLRVCDARLNFWSLMCQEMESNVMQYLSRRYLTNGNVWKEAELITLHYTQVQFQLTRAQQWYQSTGRNSCNKVFGFRLLPETNFGQAVIKRYKQPLESIFLIFLIPCWFWPLWQPIIWITIEHQNVCFLGKLGDVWHK